MPRIYGTLAKVGLRWFSATRQGSQQKPHWVPLDCSPRIPKDPHGSPRIPLSTFLQRSPSTHMSLLLFFTCIPSLSLCMYLLSLSSHVSLLSPLTCLLAFFPCMSSLSLSFLAYLLSLSAYMSPFSLPWHVFLLSSLTCLISFSLSLLQHNCLNVKFVFFVV